MVEIITLILMLFVLSFLMGDNPFFKFTERLIVGISAGYGFLKLFDDGFIKKFWIPLFQDGQYWVIIPGLLGMMFFFTFSKKWNFLAKYPLAFLLGTGVGLEIGPRIETSILRQINATAVNFSGMSAGQVINYIIILIALLTTMYYFLFVLRRDRPAEKLIANVGIFFMMLGFGASFGYTIMGRISLLIEVINIFFEKITSIF
ncbi:hypothetical protein KAJ26_03210 [bacterium]|nr:hypothetical protein [bacterium]